MGYDVYGLNPKNVEYLEANHPGDFDFSKFSVNSPEYKDWHMKEWEVKAISGVYFRQSIGGYWDELMYWAKQVIEDLPNSVLYNEGYVINEEDAIKIADYIGSKLVGDKFRVVVREYLTSAYPSKIDNLDKEVDQFEHIVSKFVEFAKNSGGFRIS